MLWGEAQHLARSSGSRTLSSIVLLDVTQALRRRTACAGFCPNRAHWLPLPAAPEVPPPALLPRREPEATITRCHITAAWSFGQMYAGAMLNELGQISKYSQLLPIRLLVASPLLCQTVASSAKLPARQLLRWPCQTPPLPRLLTCYWSPRGMQPLEPQPT